MRLPVPGNPTFGPDVLDFLGSGLAGGLGSTLFKQFFQKAQRRPDNLIDESVGSFISRHAHRRIAENLVSALFHGIYAGDVWQLSAKTLLPMWWDAETRFNSLMDGFMIMTKGNPGKMSTWWEPPYQIEKAAERQREIKIEPEFWEELKSASTFTLRGGLGQLVERLKQKLEKNPRVEIKYDSYIGGMDLTQDKRKVELKVLVCITPVLYGKLLY